MIVVWIVTGLLAGFALAAFVLFAYFLVRWVRNLTSAMVETNRLLKQLVENSDLASGLKSFKEIVETGRGMLRMMATLNTTITLFYQMATNNQGIPGVGAPASDENSSFTPYDEQKAAEVELQGKLRAHGINLGPKEPASEGAVGAQV